MKLTTFTGLTPEEFLRLNEDKLPPGILEYFNGFAVQIKELQEEVASLNKSNELAWEQVSFARDLILQLDYFAENNLTKPKLKMYNHIRNDSTFEV